MNTYMVRALVDDNNRQFQIEREVKAMSVFGAVSLVTVDLWEDSRAVTALTTWLIAEPWEVDPSGCVSRRSEH